VPSVEIGLYCMERTVSDCWNVRDLCLAHIAACQCTDDQRWKPGSTVYWAWWFELHGEGLSRLCEPVNRCVGPFCPYNQPVQRGILLIHLR
jgi:hypothetical protein